MATIEDVSTKIREKFASKARLGREEHTKIGRSNHLPVRIELFQTIFSYAEWMEVGRPAMMRIIEEAASENGLTPLETDSGYVFGWDLTPEEKHQLAHPKPTYEPTPIYQKPQVITVPPDEQIPEAKRSGRARDSDGHLGDDPTYTLNDM